MKPLLSLISYNRVKETMATIRSLKATGAFDEADVVVAMLDGSDSDSGTALEVGYAMARGKPIVGVRTDFRKSQDRGVNLMLSQACTRYIFDMSFSEDTGRLARRIARAVQNVREKPDGRSTGKADRV